MHKVYGIPNTKRVMWTWRNHILIQEKLTRKNPRKIRELGHSGTALQMKLTGIPGNRSSRNSIKDGKNVWNSKHQNMKGNLEFRVDQLKYHSPAKLFILFST